MKNDRDIAILSSLDATLALSFLSPENDAYLIVDACFSRDSGTRLLQSLPYDHWRKMAANAGLQTRILVLTLPGEYMETFGNCDICRPFQRPVLVIARNNMTFRSIIEKSNQGFQAEGIDSNFWPVSRIAYDFMLELPFLTRLMRRLALFYSSLNPYRWTSNIIYRG